MDTVRVLMLQYFLKVEKDPTSATLHRTIAQAQCRCSLWLAISLFLLLFNENLTDYIVFHSFELRAFFIQPVLAKGWAGVWNVEALKFSVQEAREKLH